jgi:hypothetical protein
MHACVCMCVCACVHACMGARAHARMQTPHTRMRVWVQVKGIHEEAQVYFVAGMIHSGSGDDPTAWVLPGPGGDSVDWAAGAGEVRGARCEVRGARCEVRGARCEVRGARCEVRGARCKVRGARCEVRGARCEVQGARCVVRGREERRRQGHLSELPFIVTHITHAPHYTAPHHSTAHQFLAKIEYSHCRDTVRLRALRCVAVLT